MWILPIQVLGRDRGPRVHPVHDVHRHPARKMGLNVAVQVEGARVGDLVAEGDPGGP